MENEVEAAPEEQEELDLLYMARTLRESLQVEELLTKAGVEYVVETGTYVAGFLMKRELTGAFFYVSPAKLEFARQTLRNSRLQPYLKADRNE